VKATGISITGYASQCKVPEKTLGPYLSGKKELGKEQGRPGLLKKDEEALMVENIRRYDRSRKGLAPKGVADLGHETRPALSDEQARSLGRHVRPFFEKPVWGTGVWLEKRRARNAIPGKFDIGPRCSAGRRGGLGCYR